MTQSAAGSCGAGETERTGTMANGTVADAEEEEEEEEDEKGLVEDEEEEEAEDDKDEKDIDGPARQSAH